MEDQPKNDFFDSLWVVLVIYKMRIPESPTYQSLTSALQHINQSASLFIYDNSPQPQEVLTNSCWNMHYHHDASNVGVSRAYNEGFKNAKSENKKWILFTDQDTIFPDYIFDSYFNIKKENPTMEIFVPTVTVGTKVISPFRFSFGRGTSLSTALRKRYSIDDLKFINSGLLVSSHLFERCNGFDEHFPLDFSDLVFAQRVKKFQREFLIADAVCSHHLSSHEKSFAVSLNRFRVYLRASKLYGKLYDSSTFLFLNRFLRGLKLSLKFRTVEFLKSFVKLEFNT